MRYLIPASVLISMFAFVGCATDEPLDPLPMPETPTALATPVNDTCPIMGGDVTEDGGSVEWNGKMVGFCCPECIDKWNALSDDEKTAKLADKGDGADTETSDEAAG